VLELEGDASAEPESDIVHGEKVVGRITSAVPGLALGYVRVEVPDDAELAVGGTKATLAAPPSGRAVHPRGRLN
jgi:hypothetical protein